MGSATVRTHVILPEELVKAVDETVGQRKRSHFIEEAVREKLARARLIEAFDRLDCGTARHAARHRKTRDPHVSSGERAGRCKRAGARQWTDTAA